MNTQRIAKAARSLITYREMPGISIEIVDNAVIVAFDYHIGSRNPNQLYARGTKAKPAMMGQCMFDSISEVLTARGIEYVSVEIEADTVTFYC